MFESIKIFAFSSNNIGSFVAGVLVIIITGLVAFFIKDIVKKPPSFSGVFYLKLATESSAWKKYEGLASFFVLTLINESSTKIIGKIEKIYDIENDGKYREYIGENRNTGDVLITIERYYLRRNKMNIHISLRGDAKGVQRPSSVIVTINKVKLDTVGTFTTTAADAHGIAFFKNKSFKDEL
ncbi:Uncharacterised protein [Klebsiella quasipneumoniae]|nr:hypothetical protein [Klebsiella quasipneumoniae]MBR7425986.1 hypothetical protein [Klebsiella quasipneumoniae]MBR7459340.1 hypothetical protein [Klebsiella quasipneumoniae]MCL1444688.1 hypothetical protein [Klebsiella quasipneumoniae]MCW9324713.1 hypothetical protein [Klebsiella quasipneumoniae]MCW9334541.1 hypothetical protein [Klebsiella quasipneumoniae]